MMTRTVGLLCYWMFLLSAVVDQVLAKELGSTPSWPSWLASQSKFHTFPHADPLKNFLCCNTAGKDVRDSNAKTGCDFIVHCGPKGELGILWHPQELKCSRVRPRARGASRSSGNFRPTVRTHVQSPSCNISAYDDREIAIRVTGANEWLTEIVCFMVDLPRLSDAGGKTVHPYCWYTQTRTMVEVSFVLPAYRPVSALLKDDDLVQCADDQTLCQLTPSECLIGLGSFLCVVARVKVKEATAKPNATYPTSKSLTYKGANDSAFTWNQTTAGCEQTANHSIAVVLGVVASLTAVAVAAVIVAVILYRRQSQKAKHVSSVHRPLTAVPTVSSDSLTLPGLPEPRISKPQVTSRLSDHHQRQMARHNVQLLQTIGKGNFGIVVKALARKLPVKISGHSSDAWTVVAVKMVVENAKGEAGENFLHELKVMRTVPHHVNVVRLLGCCTKEDPLLMVMDYAQHGDLQSYLQRHRLERKYSNVVMEEKGSMEIQGYLVPRSATALTAQCIVSYALQVCRGMEHLGMCKVIHRDLAARNILVIDHQPVKVSDFGLARALGEDNVYERTKKACLPFRWMAPEALLENRYTHKSDVWSFGVLLWELVTLGNTPYPNLNADEVRNKIKARELLQCPSHVADEIKTLMNSCWSDKTEDRPSFYSLKTVLESHLESAVPYLDLNQVPYHDYCTI